MRIASVEDELNVAVTLTGADTVRFWGLVAPLRLPEKPLNTRPLLGVAVIVTTEPRCTYNRTGMVG